MYAIQVCLGDVGSKWADWRYFTGYRNRDAFVMFSKDERETVDTVLFKDETYAEVECKRIQAISKIVVGNEFDDIRVVKV